MTSHLDAVCQTYLRELERRLRSGNSRTYVPAEDLAHFTGDPNADPEVSRPPGEDEVYVTLIGGGLGNLVLGGGVR